MIDIVTAYFDIGREHWTEYRRTKSEYMSFFRHVCQLENRIVVYTSANLVGEISSIRPDLPIIPVEDYTKLYVGLLDRIATVQKSPEFSRRRGGATSPEYIYPEYVLVVYLKWHFVHDAILAGHVQSDMVAWIDFGYGRSDDVVPCRSWNYDFDKDKIHFFGVREIPEDIDVEVAALTNDVYIQGGHVVASRSNFIYLKHRMFDTLHRYLNKGIVDDDQSALLSLYMEDRDICEYHLFDTMDPWDWFRIFKDYNEPLGSSAVESRPSQCHK